jgi:hypothetical protein
VQVWDSNHVLPVASFQLDHRVYCAAMSPLAHAHALIAAGSGNPAVSDTLSCRQLISILQDTLAGAGLCMLQTACSMPMLLGRMTACICR